MIIHRLKQASFFQELFKLFKQIKPDSELTRLATKKLKMRAASTLQFPVRDIDKIIETDNELTIICQFMGLYGVDSPLPVYFNALCLKENEADQPLCAFLDIFNHRNYALYYQAWHAFYLEQDDLSSHAYQTIVQAISEHEKNGLILSYGVNSSLISIKNACKHFFPHACVTLDEQVPTWVGLESQALLGRDLVLNHNSLIGSRIYDRTSKVHLNIGPVNECEALRLLQEEIFFDALNWMTRVNNPYQIEFDLILKIKFECASFSMGQATARLGQTTILGLAFDEEYRITIRI